MSTVNGHGRGRIDAVTKIILAYLAGLGDTLSAYVARASMVVDELVPGLEAETHEIAARSRAHQVGTIIAGIVIGAAIIIGLFVVATLNTSLPAIQNTELQNARNQTVARVGDAMLLGSVVIIVLFAAVILRVLRGL